MENSEFEHGASYFFLSIYVFISAYVANIQLKKLNISTSSKYYDIHEFISMFQFKLFFLSRHSNYVQVQHNTQIWNSTIWRFI